MEIGIINTIYLIILIYAIFAILTTSLWVNYVNSKANVLELFIITVFTPIVIVVGAIILLVGWVTFVQHENKINRRKRKFKRNNSHLKYTTNE